MNLTILPRKLQGTLKIPSSKSVGHRMAVSYTHLHQEDALVRENGVPYAAFGLLWRKFGPVFFVSKCTEGQISEAVQRFDESFVQPLDLDDNTGCGNMLASIIGAFNPYWDENSDSDRNF